MTQFSAPSATITVNLTLAEWLALLGLGRQTNVSFVVTHGTTQTQQEHPIFPRKGDTAILLASLQFDAVTSGQVGFNLMTDKGGDIAGYAVNGIPSEINAICEGECTFQIQNASANDCVVNFDYLSLSQSNLNMVRQLLEPVQSQFGLSTGRN